MTAPRFPRFADPRRDPEQTATSDRTATARLLRAARSARGWRRGTALARVVETHPGHRHARRRLAAHLIEDLRDLPGVERLLNEGLLLHPTDDVLARLRAQLLLLRGEPRAASREIRLTLERRPQHVASLLLGARIAETRGNRPEAIELLERAAAERPRCEEIKHRLVEVLLAAGGRRRARAVAATIDRPAPALQARILDTEGRADRAMAVLEAAHVARPTDERVTVALIDLVERHGTPERLAEIVRTVGPDQPAALVRAGKATLLLGAFEDVLARLGTLRRSGPYRLEALAISAVAASMAARRGLARRIQEELRRTPGGASPAFLSDLWRRGLMSRLHDGTTIARTIGIEREPGILENMTRRALEVLDEPAARGSVPAVTAIDVAHHRAACLTALGRGREAEKVRRDAGEAAETATPAPAEAPPLRKAA